MATIPVESKLNVSPTPEKEGPMSPHVLAQNRLLRKPRALQAFSLVVHRAKSRSYRSALGLKNRTSIYEYIFALD